MIVNKKNIDFDLCAYSNVYILMHINYFFNKWFPKILLIKKHNI